MIRDALLPKWVNFDEIGISPITLHFRDKDVERQFCVDTTSDSIVYIRVCLWFAAALIVSYTPFDFILFSSNANNLYKALICRYIFVFAGIITLLILTYRWSKIAYTSYARWCIIWAFLGWPLFIYNTNTDIVVYAFPALIMNFGYAFFLVGMFFMQSIILALFMVTIYSAMIFVEVPSFWLAFTTVTSLYCIYAILALACYHKELVLRKAYILSIKERTSFDRFQRHASQSIDWHRNMGRLLRHETGNHISAIKSSAEIIHDVPSADIPSHAEGILSRVTRLNDTLDKMTHANDMAAFISESNETEFHIEEFIEGIEDLYDIQYGNGVLTVQCNVGGIISAHRDILEMALFNIINNAISYAKEGTSVNLLVHPRGGFIEFLVQNTGPMLNKPKEELLEPFYSDRDGGRDGHIGFGLYFSKMVAEKHNGKIDIHNNEKLDGVDVVVSVPI